MHVKSSSCLFLLSKPKAFIFYDILSVALTNMFIAYFLWDFLSPFFCKITSSLMLKRLFSHRSSHKLYPEIFDSSNVNSVWATLKC